MNVQEKQAFSVCVKIQHKNKCYKSTKAVVTKVARIHFDFVKVALGGKKVGYPCSSLSQLFLIK